MAVRGHLRSLILVPNYQSKARLHIMHHAVKTNETDTDVMKTRSEVKIITRHLIS